MNKQGHSHLLKDPLLDAFLLDHRYGLEHEGRHLGHVLLTLLRQLHIDRKEGVVRIAVALARRQARRPTWGTKQGFPYTPNTLNVSSQGKLTSLLRVGFQNVEQVSLFWEFFDVRET